jgi:pyruvate formate lyase activating enzyme
MDAEQHRKETGVGTDQIRANVIKMAEEQKKIWLRVPLIDGYNDSDENFIRLAELGKEIKAERISVLLYHELGAEKYKQIGRKYTYHAQEPSPARIEKLKEIIQDQDLSFSIGD